MGYVFVCGTGTDVGKTYVTGLLVKKIKEVYGACAYYKAAMSGNIRDEEGRLIPGDAAHVKEVSGIDQELFAMCPYVYEAAVSPHLASRIEGNPVDIAVVKKGFEEICKEYSHVVVEGSGGILCPIDYDTKKLWLEDVIRELAIDCILVADAGLGTINSVGLTSYYMKSENIRIRGIIFNNYIKGDVMHEDNIRMCRELTGLPVLACVSKNQQELDITDEMLKLIIE